MIEGMNPTSPGLLAATIEPLGVDPRAAFDQLHALGYRQAQLSAAQPGLRPRELDRSARRDLLATLRRRELTVSGIDLWIPPSHWIEPATADRAVTALREAVELAGDLGRVPVSVTLPAENEADELIRFIASLSERYGAPVADHALEASTDRAGIDIGVDPPVQLGDGRDPAAAALEAGAQLASVRLCDLLRTGQRGPVGDAHDGRLDVAAFRATLDVAGYAGPVVVDARGWIRPVEGLASSLAMWNAAGPG
jgi:sugar phosphate isomerase/epimerase